MILDEHLSWRPHISSVESKLSKNVGILSKARCCINTEAAKSLYFAFLHPYIAFGNIIWASTHKTKLERIHKLQKRAVRIISNAAKDCHSKPLLKYHKILDVYEINILQSLTFMYKHFTHRLPRIFNNLVRRIDHPYGSRLSEFGYKERLSKNSIHRCLIRSRGPFLWNRLKCSKAKQSANVAQFKFQLKRCILESASPITR